MNEIQKLLLQKKRIQNKEQQNSDYGILINLLNEKLKTITGLTLKIKFLRQILKETQEKAAQVSDWLEYLQLEYYGPSQADDYPDYVSHEKRESWLHDFKDHIENVLLSYEKDYYKELCLILVNRLLKKDGATEIEILF